MIFFFCQNTDTTSVAFLSRINFVVPQKLKPPPPPLANNNKNKSIRDYVKALL